MRKIRLFLASSADLKSEREAFEREIYRKTKVWKEDGLFLHLDIWEDLSQAMSATRLQDEYNRYVRQADIFVMLAHGKIGRYTAEEFEQAFDQFQRTRKPFIFTYIKPSAAEADSLRQFRDRLRALGHFEAPFTDATHLWNQFNTELDRLKRADFGQHPHAAGHTGQRSITQGAHSQYIESAHTVNIHHGN